VLRLTSSGRLLLQKASATWFFFVSLSTTDKPHNIFLSLFRVSKSLMVPGSGFTMHGALFTGRCCYSPCCFWRTERD
jgi:hypothetical protein